MDKKIKNLYKYLKSKINYHNKKYHEKDNPEISDYEYDLLLKELENLEKEYPELKIASSPTNLIGGRKSKKFSSVIHEVKMESLHNSYSKEELVLFDNKIRKIVQNYEYVIEPKIDGLSVSVEYKHGKLFRASTRGDGIVGENITENIFTVKNLPKEIDFKDYLEVRGEVYISNENFLNLIKNQKLNNKRLFKNPRNAAAGSLRQKNSKISAERNLEIIIFNIQKIENFKINTHKESLDFLKKLNFSVPPFYNLHSNIEETFKKIDEIEKLKNKLCFQIDGVVLKVNELNKREILGSTSKYPRWAEAFKYPPEEKITKILDIKVTVGRTGILTPMAVLKSILISGTIVSKATLHNENFIIKKSIKIGDKIVLRKAGEIIPEVVRVYKTNEFSKKFAMPEFCPSCNSKITKESNVISRCDNINCPVQLLRNLIHFVSRDAMNIKSLGEKIIQNLVGNEFLLSVVDFYKLSSESFKKLYKSGEKIAENIINEIENSKNNSLDKLLFALGIRNLGKKSAYLVSENFKNIDNIINSNKKEILEINTIGEKIAESIRSYFSVDQNLQNIILLKKLGLNTTFLESKNSSEKFKNKKFVITGTLENYTRSEITKLIEKSGGTCSNSISKNTDYLILGKKSGIKLEKAKKINVKILNEKEFEKYFDLCPKIC
ncbi:MAG: NAD-dependent DNA ligase LigA [Candidatus Paraimprobicoccus trichonymphae]|uniref:DNA ligase n=1 Tax=Candidatus Paraimprobicoccus trichonymphae TaxID=3033793 RepID=A0AA48I0F5_9FIRM|nr:MAG: NAD-dependent DNA ligase LigA [Candidatus Paraimprobicoccus trichonymphae]